LAIEGALRPLFGFYTFEKFPTKFSQPDKSDGYIPINFVKDLRAHIAAKRPSHFGGTPPPGGKI
jgi:hypothetical protein